MKGKPSERLKAFQRAYDRMQFRSDARQYDDLKGVEHDEEHEYQAIRANRMEENLRLLGWSSLLCWALVLLLIVGSVSAHAQMISGFQARGYGGPVGSDVSGDPATLTVVFEGRDEFGQIVQAVVPVEVELSNLNAALNYATFEPNLVNTSYLRGNLATRGVTDIDGDEILSQVSEVTGLPAGGVYLNCTVSGGGTSTITATSVPDCLQKGAGLMDSLGGYTFAFAVADASSGTYPANAAGDDCRLDITWTRVGESFSGSPRTSVLARYRFDMGFNVTNVSQCGSHSLSLVVEDYDGDPLIGLFDTASRHFLIGDVLAASAYVDEVMPPEILDMASQLTEAMEDEEGDYYGCAECIYAGAYDEAPLYWREGYTFAPFGLGIDSDSGGGGGGGFSCEEEATTLACLELPGEDEEVVSDGELGELFVDPLGEATFGAYVDEWALEGFGVAGDCPAPFELELPDRYGGGVMEVPTEDLCYGMQTFLSPILALLAWLAAAVILFRS